MHSPPFSVHVYISAALAHIFNELCDPPVVEVALIRSMREILIYHFVEPAKVPSSSCYFSSY